MLSTIITLIGAIVALVVAARVKKPLTKSVTIALALSSVISLDPVVGIGEYGYLFFAIVSMIAAVEPSSSLNLKKRHKSFFLVTGVVIVLMAISHFLELSDLIPKYVFGILYCIALAIFWLGDNHRLKSRGGIQILWLVEALKWAATIPINE